VFPETVENAKNTHGNKGCLPVDQNTEQEISAESPMKM